MTCRRSWPRSESTSVSSSPRTRIPDGDALGSLLAMHLALAAARQGERDVPPGRGPASRRVHVPALASVQRTPPADHAERVLVAVDCAKEERLGPDPALLERAPVHVDIDHHHDNTRFGDVNLIVADASSTGEILSDVFAELGVEITPEIAEPLYVALVTDTGRFQYANTSPKTLRLAADLIEAGADWHKVFQTVYENVQFAKLKLLARALERAEVHSGGRLVISHLRKNDFVEVGAAEPYSEGIIDYLRAVEGAMVAALIREPPRGNGPAHRVSLRASVDEIDVSVIARKSQGGGHRQAAGFSSELSLDELKRFIVEEFEHAAASAARLAGSSSPTSRRARPRSTSSRRAATNGRANRPRGNARPLRDRPAPSPLRRGDPAAASLRRARQALRDGDRPRRDDDDRRPRGRGRRGARGSVEGRARGAARRAARPDRSADPRGLGREDRRRARLPAAPARRRGRDAGTSHGRPRAPARRLRGRNRPARPARLLGHVRSGDRGGARGPLPRAAPDGDRAVLGRRGGSRADHRRRKTRSPGLRHERGHRPRRRSCTRREQWRSEASTASTGVTARSWTRSVERALRPRL